MVLHRKLVVASALVIAACSSTPERQEVEGSVDELYNNAQNALESKKYETAVNTFEELERQHPYSNWATRAQMMVAYTYYKSKNYDEAVIAADRFARLHPGHKDLPYVYYLRGLSFYERISDVKRDQGFTHEALQAFEELVRRYPESDYARDAKLKITLCKDHLAGQEMMIGRYYQSNKRYMAAINRYRTVIERYETSSQTPEALFRLTESYLSLGINDEAQMAGAVLGHNFQASDWYKDAFSLLEKRDLKPATSNDSWLKNMVKGVKDVF